MKKNLFILLAAAAFAACSSDDVLVDNSQPVNDVAIGFSTYAGNVTRAENNSTDYDWDLKDHHTSFKVWGYKNTATAKVFNAQQVNWNNTAWTYPARFWDKAATTYQFYAAAPALDEWEFCGGDDAAQDSHFFKYQEAAVYGDNATPEDNSYVRSFSACANDKDLMIAAPCAVDNAQFGSNVQLNFNHILSRLNVTVRTSLASPVVVKLVSLEVFGLKNVGNFDENAAGAKNDHPGNNSRWSSQYGAVTLKALTEYTVENVGTKDKYVLQSLVIPQNVAIGSVKLDGSDATTATAPYIKIVYTIDADGDGTAVDPETFIVYYDLATVFGRTDAETLAFNEGWQNTLNITIAPAEIKFDAKVSEWSDNYNVDKTVN